jgi:hypothetical protein
VERKGGAGSVLAAAAGGSDEGRGGRCGLGVALGRGARGAGRRRRGVPHLGHGAGAGAGIAAAANCSDLPESEVKRRKGGSFVALPGCPTWKFGIGTGWLLRPRLF